MRRVGTTIAINLFTLTESKLVTGLRMKTKFALITLLVAGLVGVNCTAAWSEVEVVGGITPDQRPQEFPVVTATGLTPAGEAMALYGVKQPYPPSLKWLNDQGGWYTPFIHPGMTGPYDIRHWHAGSDR